MRIVARRGKNTYLVLVREDESKRDNDRNAIGSVVDLEDGKITVYPPLLVFAIVSRGYWKQPEDINESTTDRIIKAVSDFVTDEMIAVSGAR